MNNYIWSGACCASAVPCICPKQGSRKVKQKQQFIGMWAILLFLCCFLLLSYFLFLVWFSFPVNRYNHFFSLLFFSTWKVFQPCCAANLCKLHVLCRAGFQFCTTSVVVHVLSSNHPSPCSQGILITAFAFQDENKSWLIPIRGCVGTWTPQLLFGLVQSQYWGTDTFVFCSTIVSGLAIPSKLSQWSKISIWLYSLLDCNASCDH